MKRNYLKLSEKEKENIRNISCVEVLERMGLEGKKEGKTIRFKNSQYNIVVTPENNRFFDNESLVGGGGAIDVLMMIFKYSFTESVLFLSGSKGFQISNQQPKTINKPAKKKYAELPAVGDIKNETNVINYLVGYRKISSNLVNHFLDSGLLYADARNNCVFVNEARTFCFIRGTYIPKKFTSNNGDVDFFIYKFQKDKTAKKNVYLFESVIDAMSFYTLTRKIGVYIILNGNGMINRINELSLNDYENVYCCFDNDEQGDKFIGKVKLICKKAKTIKPVLKDFNADLMAKHSSHLSPAMSAAV